MCGRYTLHSDIETLQQRFHFTNTDLAWDGSYNIAPTQSVPVITNQDQRRAQLMRWGLVPFWAKDISVGNRMINARAESVATSSAFRQALRRRRCLIPANGFYEWRKEGKLRIPNYAFLKSQEPFAFAGLWETWKSPSDEFIHSFTILTTQANGLMEPIHNRMPVILSEEAEVLWLDPLTEDPDAIKHLLAPFPADEMDAYGVSTLVNSPANAGPECIAPIAV